LGFALEMNDGVFARCIPRLAVVGMPTPGCGLLYGSEEVQAIPLVRLLHLLSIADLQAQYGFAGIVDVADFERVRPNGVEGWREVWTTR